MTKMRVKEGCELKYPDGTVRGIAGYIVNWSNAEQLACEGQEDSLESCGDFHSADPVDASMLEVEAPAPKKAKKKAKKKAAKK